MSRNGALKDNGWRLMGKCWSCGWIGSTKHVCPSCGAYYELMTTVVARWVSTLKWYHYLCIEIGDRGYWEERK